MFPLGSVLVPGELIPLHVFEPRYRQLVHDCLEGSPELGIVLIERGSEVGGGDVRTDVGTLGRLADARALPDGRWAIAVVGERRIRVTAWLDDDPYPRAEVELWPDPAPGADHDELLERVAASLRTTLTTLASKGTGGPPVTGPVAADPVLAGYQMIALAPIGPLDRQRLLAAPTPEARLEDLDRMLAEVRELVALEGEVGPPPEDG